jgi:hypothetical protein
MSEPGTDAGTRPIEADAKPTIEDRDFKSILKALIGKKCTVVNPESYEAATVGFQLKQGQYVGKIGGLGQDYLIFHTVIETSKKEGGKAPVKQFIPLGRVKRISLMKDNYILHL